MTRNKVIEQVAKRLEEEFEVPVFVTISQIGVEDGSKRVQFILPGLKIPVMYHPSEFTEARIDTLVEEIGSRLAANMMIQADIEEDNDNEPKSVFERFAIRDVESVLMEAVEELEDAGLDARLCPDEEPTHIHVSVGGEDAVRLDFNTVTKEWSVETTVDLFGVTKGVVIPIKRVDDVTLMIDAIDDAEETEDEVHLTLHTPRWLKKQYDRLTSTLHNDKLGWDEKGHLGLHFLYNTTPLQEFGDFAEIAVTASPSEVDFLRTELAELDVDTCELAHAMLNETFVFRIIPFMLHPGLSWTAKGIYLFFAVHMEPATLENVLEASLEDKVVIMEALEELEDIGYSAPWEEE